MTQVHKSARSLRITHILKWFRFERAYKTRSRNVTAKVNVFSYIIRDVHMDVVVFLFFLFFGLWWLITVRVPYIWLIEIVWLFAERCLNEAVWSISRFNAVLVPSEGRCPLHVVLKCALLLTADQSNKLLAYSLTNITKLYFIKHGCVHTFCYWISLIKCILHCAWSFKS